MGKLIDITERIQRKLLQESVDEAFDALDDWFALHDELPEDEARRVHRERWPGLWEEAGSK